MEEVEILCDRIIILDKGKVIAQGTIDELKTLAKIEEKVTVEVTNLEEKFVNKIISFKNVENVTYNNSLLIIAYKKGKNNLLELIDYLKSEGI